MHSEQEEGEELSDGRSETTNIVIPQEVLERYGCSAVDFKGEALTFKVSKPLKVSQHFNVYS